MYIQQPFITLIHWVVSALSFMLTAYLVPGFTVRGFKSALIASVVVGLANIFIWPVLMFLTLPINILTLGLFTFIVNAAVLKICASVLSGFKISSWMSAIFGSMVLSIVAMVLHYFII